MPLSWECNPITLGIGVELKVRFLISKDTVDGVLCSLTDQQKYVSFMFISSCEIIGLCAIGKGHHFLYDQVLKNEK